MTPSEVREWVDRCRDVLDMVLVERANQVSRYGFNDDLEEGVGPGVQWLCHTDVNLDLRTASEIEKAFRAEYDRLDKPTWMHLVREEIAEAFAEEPGSDELVAELIQVAALCVSWVERIKRRG
jgi:hypothetical protein